LYRFALKVCGSGIATSSPTRHPERVLRYTFVLWLLLACFLNAVGFTTEEFAAFARRSEMYRQVEAQFFRDWQLQILGRSRT
jgi:hypothetical protein